MPYEVSDKEIEYLDEMLKDINGDISVSMSYVRRAQGLTFEQLGEKFSGINVSTIKRYMQQSYPSIRPIHLVAAMSWVMMVPMTSFYYGFRLKEYYRGMDDDAVQALMCVGRLPSNQFEHIVSLIRNLLDTDQNQHISSYCKDLESEFGSIDNYDDLFPPQVLDLDAFAMDYYRSIAITVKIFREKNDITKETIARVLGLSSYQYDLLEDQYKTTSFPVAIGFRVKLGFKLASHVNFTSEMRMFPEFHELRKAQQFRDALIIEVLRHVPAKHKPHVINLLLEIAKIYI
ncbi:hypothetical protein OAP63_18630 [Vibrio sp.]|nr:hypothetical protein [Vibrio viridaestus]MDC0612750.1 hypothetical protein [Vibrio sp.]